jgi:hypothetical protein
MYNILKGLNGNTIHANGAIAWHDFVTLWADNCKTIWAYIGNFHEALIDLNSQGISFRWRNPDSQTSTTNAVDELIVIHFLQGLETVMPDWVEAQNNKLQRDTATRWTLNALVASLKDHICYTNSEPVNTFLTLAKKEEEARVLAQLTSQNKPIPAAQPASSSATTAAKVTTPKKSKHSVAHCNPCDRIHAGPNKACWYAHPELYPKNWTDRRPESVKKAAAERENKREKDNQTNVTIAEDEVKTYGAHVFQTIANVSPAILEKAVNDKDYQNRYCYDMAANCYVFNSKAKFIEYQPTNSSTIRGSTGSTLNAGVGTVAIDVVKSDGTTELIHLRDVLYCPDFATNVICQ